MESAEKEESEGNRKEETTEAGKKTKKDSGESVESEREGLVVDEAGSATREKWKAKETGKRGRPTNAERFQRSRTGSERSILEFYGRKRGREAEEEEEREGKTIRKRYNSEAAQLRPTKLKEEKGQNEKEKMDIEKLKGMTDVKEMIIHLATCMSMESMELKKEFSQLRKSLEKEREEDRKRMDELDKKIKRRQMQGMGKRNRRNKKR